jgi:hypothetical protein
MKQKIFLFILLVVSGLHLKAQDELMIGFSGGTTGYLGDYNKDNPFYAPSPSYGFILQTDFDYRYSSQFLVNFNRVRGNLNDFPDFVYLNRQITKESFNKKFVELSMVLHFNFFPYNTYTVRKDNFTPYVYLGGGTNYYFDGEKINFPLIIPFGLGIKYNIFERFSIGIEWGARKMFYDTMDGVENIYDSGNVPVIHNDDWYHSTFLFLTFKPFREDIDCPAYED